MDRRGLTVSYFMETPIGIKRVKGFTCYVSVDDHLRAHFAKTRVWNIGPRAYNPLTTML